MNTNRIGKEGEGVAARYLRDRGYQLVAQNYRCKRGEIDLIAVEQGTVVFCEVKTWRSFGADQIEYSIDSRKKNRILFLARGFLREHPEFEGMPVRFDVIFVPGYGGQVQHYTHAFDEG